MAKSMFPVSFQFDNETWHLQYDPANPMTVKPDLTHSRIMKAACDPVTLPNTEKTLYLVVLDIIIPATQPVSLERRLLAIRIYDARPVSLEAVNPNEMLYYVAQPKFDNEGNRSQALFNTLLGQVMTESQPEQKIDRGWGKSLLGDVIQDD